jgi:hypothetical protein
MIRFAIFLSFLLATKCFAETLSTGEDVATFVQAQIDAYGVSFVRGTRMFQID